METLIAAFVQTTHSPNYFQKDDASPIKDVAARSNLTRTSNQFICD